MTDILNVQDSTSDDLREANRRLLVAGLFAHEAADRSELAVERINALLAAFSEGVIVLGADGAIVLMNPAANRILGLPHGPADDEALRGISRRRLDGSDMPYEESPLARARRGEEFSEFEQLIADGGSVRHLVVNANCTRDGAGLMLQAILTIRDVTELRELERNRDEHLSAVSHDLRNPLTIVVGASRRLVREGANADGAEKAELLDLIESGATRLAMLIDDLLESSSLASGELKMEFEPVAMGPLVAAAIKRVAATTADHRRIRLVSPETSVIASGDRLRIERVVVNLLSNALKYSPAGSPIEVSVGRERGEAIVSVRDYGIGIAPNDLARVFDRFFRVQSAVFAGHGLGLFIARRILESHGGRIWAESTPGAGSTFSFALTAGRRAAPGRG